MRAFVIILSLSCFSCAISSGFVEEEKKDGVAAYSYAGNSGEKNGNNCVIDILTNSTTVSNVILGCSEGAARDSFDPPDYNKKLNIDINKEIVNGTKTTAGR